MSFILFRNGQTLTLSSGENLNYRYLIDQGFSDHQARAVYMAAKEEGMNIKTVKEWISDFKDPKRRTARVQALNAIVAKNLSPSASSEQALKPEPVKRKTAGKKVFVLYSRSNHQEASKKAQLVGLNPQPLTTGQALPEGVSSDALVLHTDEKTASSLITTGYWRSA